MDRQWEVSHARQQPGQHRHGAAALDLGRHAAVQFFGKLPEMTHEGGEDGIRENFTLVGEAIPQSGLGVNGDPTLPLEYTSRFGAPWFALASVPSGAWWNLGTGSRHPNRTNIADGYNIHWSAAPEGVPLSEAWATTPVYFGVQKGGYLDLT